MLAVHAPKLKKKLPVYLKQKAAMPTPAYTTVYYNGRANDAVPTAFALPGGTIAWVTAIITASRRADRLHLWRGSLT
jgi:hypothetical protein